VQLKPSISNIQKTGFHSSVNSSRNEKQFVSISYAISYPVLNKLNHWQSL